MKLFKPLYELALKWAAHPKAPWYLGALSFVEAIIFPVMPEVMLAPMVLAKPERWLRYATISLAGSVLGALVGAGILSGEVATIVGGIYAALTGLLAAANTTVK